MPSVDVMSTGTGSTMARSGKSAGIVPGASSRGAALPTWITACAGLRVPDLKKAIAPPSLVTAGCHSMSAPVVNARGGPPATPTRQMSRRSMSSWLEL